MNDTGCTNCGLKADVYDQEGKCPLCQSAQNGTKNNRDGGNSITNKDMSHLTDAQQRLRRAAIKAISEHGSARAAAEVLDTNHGVILMARDGKDTPAAYRALGIRKTDRYRLHYEAGRGEEGKRIREEIKDEIERMECGSFTEYVDSLRFLAKSIGEL